MNKKTYAEMFKESKENNEGVFIPFLVVGDPNYETSIEIAKLLTDKVDALEIGFPFSDPVADGKSVQEADLRAFDACITTEKCFKFLEELRKYSDIPIGLLLYYNLIFNYGIEAFYKRLSEIGINAVLTADLPPEEAEESIKIANKYGIEQIFIVSQKTSNDRLKKISEFAKGFIYVASVMGTTGARTTVEHDTTNLIKRIKEHSNLPLCVGFGISKPEHVKEILGAGSDGAIVGSALINIIADNINDKDKMMDKISKYVIKMKDATRGI